MQAKTNNAPIWYLADVVSTAAMAARPHAEQFSVQQQVYFWKSSADRWMVFDGSETYTILSTEQVSQALRSRRDEQGQVRLADDQEGLTRRFHQAARRRASVQADSDLALMLEERESVRRAEFHELPGVSQGNWEDDHQPYWRS